MRGLYKGCFSRYYKRKEDIDERDNKVFATTVIAKGVDKNGGLTSLPPETGRMGLHDTADFMELFQKQINDMKLLKQSGLAAYYQYSMRMFEAFMNQEK